MRHHLKCILFLVFAIFSFTAQSRIFPAGNQQLNYTEVMFEHPPVNGAVLYRIKVAEQVSGQFATDPVVAQCTDSTPATRISTGLRFGRKYMWRYEAMDQKRKVIFTSEIFRFSILKSPLTDPAFFQTIVTKDCQENCGKGIIFIDGLGIAVDRKGIPKWHVPGLAILPKGSPYRDLHLTESGSLLFLNEEGAFETDLSGNRVWSAPLNGVTASKKEEIYHHAITKDAQMRYMVCGKRGDAHPINGHTLFEYDTAGNEIWKFDALRSLEEYMNIRLPEDTTRIGTLGHLNGFTTDESQRFIYASFRDFNSIIKIDKREGRIVSVWGNKDISYEEKENRFDDHLFAAQHAPARLKNGNILLFNNNVQGRSSSIVELSDDPATNNGVKVWEYIIADHVPDKVPGDFKAYSEKMGVVQELSNGNILCGMGSVNRIFEITKEEQKLTWELYTRSRRDTTLPWTDAPSYRVSYTSSLYPSYFTVDQLPVANTIRANSTMKFRINNEGTEADLYTIELISSANNDVISRDEIPVGKESSVVARLYIPQAAKMTLRITAQSNPTAPKEVLLNVMP